MWGNKSERFGHLLGSRNYPLGDVIDSTVGTTGIYACGDDIRLPTEEAIVVEVGTIRFEIEAGTPRD